MKFIETPIEGAYLIEPEKKGDERGFFARVFCKKEFAEAGLQTEFVQINNSLSAERGTLRGLHIQLGEAAETKIVRCIDGALYDQILDLRPNSPTYGRAFGAELSAENRRMMYAPRGTAHGFMTLQDDTEALYLVDNYYAPDLERGVRWNDPAFDLDWPEEPRVISGKDAKRPDFEAQLRGEIED